MVDDSICFVGYIGLVVPRRRQNHDLNVLRGVAASLMQDFRVVLRTFADYNAARIASVRKVDGAPVLVDTDDGASAEVRIEARLALDLCLRLKEAADEGFSDLLVLHVSTCCYVVIRGILR